MFDLMLGVASAHAVYVLFDKYIGRGYQLFCVMTYKSDLLTAICLLSHEFLTLSLQ
jgi:hypothetical protein